MRRARAMQLVMGVFALSILAGCSDTSTEGPDPQPPAPSSSADEPVPQASTDDTLGEADASAGVATALAVMQAFSDHERSYEEWWADVQTHLSPEGRYLYEYVDPVNVPAGAVTDQGQVSAAPDATSMSVLVGTDVGQYRVDLVRETIEAPWLVDVIDPPAGLK